MTTSPRRRWFQFGLRTMFVAVTIVGVSIGYFGLQFNRLQQRRQVLDNGKVLAASLMIINYTADASKDTSIPVLWRLLGERGIATVDLYFMVGPARTADRKLLPDEQRELDRINELFPEAKVIWQIESILEQ